VNIKQLIKKFALAFAFLGFCVPFAGAQTLLTTTTLSAALAGMGSVNGATPTPNMSIVTVASATGISGPTPNTSLTSGLIATSDSQTYLYMDRELMQVKSVSGTSVTVIRGIAATAAASHASGALVFIVPLNAQILWSGSTYGQAPAVPEGSCTRSSELYLPRIQFESGIVSDCNNGQWVNGDSIQTTRQWVHGSTGGANGFRYPDPGGVALTALETNGTAPSANTQIYCTELDLPFSLYVQGLAVLNGTTVGTDKHWVILYDAAGAVLANSATAGATTSGASTYQKFNLVSPYFAVGPARYFACMGTNGTTDTIRHAATGTNDNILGGAVTGQVFGTAAAITVPSTFTTVKAPYFMAY
jgi:hypothetical protein